MAETTTRTPAEKAATTREINATKRSTTAKKAAATRAANRGASARSTTASKAKASAARGRTTAAKKAAEATQEVKNPVERSLEMAEQAVLVPVGFVLVARENVISAIEDVRAKYGTQAKTRKELKRFERRGNTAVKRVEKDLRGMIKDIETRYEPVIKNVELVSVRVENAVQTSRTAATKTSTRVQERISALV